MITKLKHMPITTESTEVTLKNAEQILGSKEDRYFAVGYKKISCELFDYRFTKNKLTASLRFDWGKNWSIKKGKATVQHLGSIDGSLVAIKVLELFLATKFNLTIEEIADCSIKRIDFSTRPCFQNLGPQHDVELTNVLSYYDKENSVINEFEILVKNFRFFIYLDLGRQFNLSQILQDQKLSRGSNNSMSYYNVGYKFTSVDIENVFLNLESRSITGNSILNYSDPIVKHGLGIGHQWPLTFIEYLSIAGQLTQILLYNLENVTREESNNMWVRSLTANFHPESTNQSNEFFSMAHFTEFNSVKIKSENWRTVTAKFKIGNIIGFAKVCHII